MVDLKNKWKNRAKRKKKISYRRKVRYNWNKIEELNYGLGITRESCYVDGNGYLRWKANDKLCHRDIANNYVFLKGGFSGKFGMCDVHHKDGNKFNNNPVNLSVLNREQHEVEHGKILFENGRKYIRIARANVTRKQTQKAILIGGKFGTWYPWSQLLVRNGYIYATEWILNQKGR